MSRFCTAVVVVVVALVATSAAGPVDSCTLQNDTAVGRFKLSTLDGLFGELLNTESYGDIYFVSICRPIPKSFYDPRKLAGAIKLTSDGHTIDLGRIDQTNVIVNEDTIVLTYVGGDRDINPKDPCKGLRWKTYVIFSCDVTAVDDTLTLVDEDPDQPDVCQVWFEIQTSKTCVRHPYVPLDILDKDLTSHYKQVISEKRTRKTKAYSNNSSIHNELSNNENSELNTHQHFSKSEVKQNNSLDSSSEDEPFININPNRIINTKILNNDREETDFHKKHLHGISFENKPYVNKNPNHKINEKEETNLHQNHSYKNNSEEEPFIYNKSNHTANEVINDEKKKENSSQNVPVEKTSNIKNNEDRINNKFLNDEYSQNTYLENKYSKNQNNKLDTDFKRENYDLKNDITSTNVSNINDNKDINHSGKNENIHTFKRKDYTTHEHRNSNLPINNTKEVNESTNIEYRNENFHNSTSKGISHYHEKHGPVNKNSKDEENIFENRSPKNDTDNFNESKDHIGGINGSNTNHFPLKNPDKKSVNISENYSKGNSIDNRVIKYDRLLPNTYYNSESKPQHGRYNSLNENSTSDDHELKDLNKNDSTNIYFKPITDHNKNVIEDIKHRNNSSSHMVFDDYKHQSGEVENESVKKHFHGLHNYNKTNDDREFNGTFMNQKYNENEHFDRSESELHGSPIDSSSSAHLSNTLGDRLKAANATTGFFEDIYLKFQNLYSKLFPNGIQFSTATILGGLGSITVFFGLIGIVINRFYHKKTGMDQIPFKGTFLCIYSYIKGFVTKIFCCGRYSEEPEDTNEKRPLLHPKNIMAPTFEDETLRKSGKYRSSDDDRQQKSKNSGDDNNSEQNKEKQYGSLLNERISPTSDKEYRKIKRKSKRSNTSSSDSGPENESWLYQDKEKLVKAERSLQDKLPKKEVSNTKKSVKPNEQVITPIELVFEKIGKRVKSSDKEKKEENIESPSKKYETKNVSETKAEDDDDESVEVIEEIVYVEDGEEEGEIVEEITETIEELPADQFDETDFEKSQSLTNFGAREKPTMVTVRKSVRKISSSFSPGEVETIEETTVGDNPTKSVKKGFGIKLGIGKSGVNMSVGEKKLGMKFGKRKEQEDKNEKEAMTVKLDKSGLKFNRKKNKSSLPTGSKEVGELDNQNLVSPEKKKKSESKSSSKLFRRSTSQPSVADISEIEDNPSPGGTIKRKFSSSTSNLFKFGKSRSKSTKSTEDKKRTL